jgi:hypothetical protein
VPERPIALPAFLKKEHNMPIKHLLDQSSFTPEHRQALELAFSHALRRLELVDRNDPICEIVAHKVIKIGASGADDAVAIAEMAVRQLAPDRHERDSCW